MAASMDTPVDSPKRKADSQIPAEESDLLLIRPLGAGQEVGRSCIMLEFKGKRIMLDCGIHPGMSGLDALPYVDLIEADEIDLLLVSHFHLDHCGALPWFLQKTTFKGRCFMTHATKAIYRWLLADYIKVSNIGTEQMLYSESDLEASMEKIETINFHEEKDVNGIRFWCYNAGHVLGAAMFMIEIAGVKVLYTGDFSRQEDRHLMAAEIPNIHPDVLIIESTYGTHIHEKREEREARFTGLVHDIVNRGGRCLIPVFALGRAQELLLILDEYWSNHPELHDIPIYYASSLAKKCMAVYQTYVNAMNERIRRQITINNPFVFKHISNLKSIEHFEDIGPCVVMASPGMMQSGLSRELFESWCTDPKNGVIIAGYCVEGTLAKTILSEPEEITTMVGQKLPLKMSVDYISFSAHTDYQQTTDLGKYTDMVMSTVGQRMSISYTGSFQMLHFFLNQLSGDVEIVEGPKKALRVFGKVTIVQESLSMVVLEWNSSPVNDLFADAVITVVLRAQCSAVPAKSLPSTLVKVDRMHFTECLMETLAEMFGEDSVGKVVKGERMMVTVNDRCAHINLRSLEVQCEGDDVLQQIVSTAVTKLYNSMAPLKV
ncbi:hypothetical protein HPB49_001854 [Dermacentor silvarum]|uniref:Uncharacterized protein n=1 Tax=Dermacentor silvarum TaxID=543639 RepID=A0ACB8CUH6_DERSI|nr:hypothetical protein HPB49_001854 [Dermacentor silvarum]